MYQVTIGGLVSVGYRGVFSFSEGLDAIQIVESEFRNWISEKEYPKDLDFEANPLYRLSPKSAVAVRTQQNGNARSSVYVLAEQNVNREWKTSIYAFSNVSRPMEQFVIVQIEVTHKSSENPIDIIEPPRFARNLLKKYEITDGAVDLKSEIKLISDAKELDSVIHQILNPRRKITINIAPSPGEHLDADWSDLLSSLTRRGVGASSTYILHESQINAFNRKLPKEFGAGPGTIRSYAAELDLTDPSNSIAHRYLKTARIHDSIENKNGKWFVKPNLQKSFNLSARSSRINFQLPQEVNSVISGLNAEIDRIWLQARLPEKSSPETQQIERRSEQHVPKTSSVIKAELLQLPGQFWERLRALIRKVLGREEISLDVISALEVKFDRFDSDLKQIEELMYETDEKRQVSDAAAKEVLESERFVKEELEATKRWVRQLELQNKDLRTGKLGLKSELRVEDKFVSDPPGLFEEIVSRLAGGSDSEYEWLREYVCFTGNPKKTIELENQAEALNYLNETWDFIHVLYDYAKSKKTSPRFDGDMDAYLNNQHKHGGYVVQRRHHSGESKSTQNRYPKERLLPVPKEVNKTGFVHMWWHFKIATSDTVSPRLHYFDDTSNTGKIYIGYIGRHLPTDQTN
jgi:hypothetical protein